MQHIIPEFGPEGIIGAICVALVFISVFSLVPEPHRQRINAILIAGAGSVYWSSGLGVAEYIFGGVMLFVAYKGLSRYYFIGIGWLLHTGWDVLHHLYAQPIIAMVPSSSAGCAVCDALLALWFFTGARNIFALFKKQNTLPA